MPITTYEINSGVIVDIDPIIRLLSPSEVPLQGGYGSDGRTTLSMNSCFEKRVDWQDDTLLTPQSTLNGAVDGVVTTITVATGEQLRFAVGDVIRLDAEEMRVTAYGGGADELIVTRGFAGTVAAAHADDVLISNLGAALPEGSPPGATRSQDRTRRFNLTSIFGPTPVRVSGTQQAIKQYGIAATEFDYQLAQRSKEELIKCEQSLIHGTRFEDATNEWRQMGGLDFYLTTNVDSTAATVTHTRLLDQQQACWDVGGSPDRLLSGSRQKRIISAFDSDDIRLGRTDNGRGQMVEYLDSDFGRLDIVLHRWIRSTHLMGFSREQATIRTLRPMQFKMLGDVGDSVQGIVVGEKTLQLEAERWGFKFTALP